MGLKSGSRDAGLDESEDDVEPDRSGDADEPPPGRAGRSSTSAPPPEPPGQSTDDQGDAGRPTMDAIPYKLRREKVNEGREQVPFFLREDVVDAEDDLQDSLEELLGEDVYKSDYREAAMVLAQRNPELVAEILREWGYDLETA